MESRYLRTLMVVAETGSFSKTAQQLHITQSAISQRIKWLEDHFGRELFHRTCTRLILTDAGAIVLEKAKAVLALENQLMDELAMLGRSHPLSVSTTPSFGIIHLPKALKAFMLRNYEITDIQLLFHIPEQAIAELRKKAIDMAIIEHCGRIDFEEFATFELPDDDLVFVSAPALEIPAGTCALDRLLRHPLYIRKEGCSSRSLLESNLQRHHLSLRHFPRVIVSDGLLLTIETVLEGGGISFISHSLVEKHIARGTLREHRIDGFTHSRLRTLAVNWNRREEEVVKSLIECIFSVFNLPPQVSPPEVSVCFTRAASV